MYEAPTNYFILLLTLNMAMLAENRPKDPARFFYGGQKSTSNDLEFIKII